MKRYLWIQTVFMAVLLAFLSGVMIHSCSSTSSATAGGRMMSGGFVFLLFAIVAIIAAPFIDREDVRKWFLKAAALFFALAFYPKIFVMMNDFWRNVLGIQTSFGLLPLLAIGALWNALKRGGKGAWIMFFILLSLAASVEVDFYSVKETTKQKLSGSGGAKTAVNANDASKKGAEKSGIGISFPLWERFFGNKSAIGSMGLYRTEKQDKIYKCDEDASQPSGYKCIEDNSYKRDYPEMYIKFTIIGESIEVNGIKLRKVVLPDPTTCDMVNSEWVRYIIQSREVAYVPSLDNNIQRPCEGGKGEAEQKTLPRRKTEEQTGEKGYSKENPPPVAGASAAETAERKAVPASEAVARQSRVDGDALWFEVIEENNLTYGEVKFDDIALVDGHVYYAYVLPVDPSNVDSYKLWVERWGDGRPVLHEIRKPVKPLPKDALSRQRIIDRTHETVRQQTIDREVIHSRLDQIVKGDRILILPPPPSDKAVKLVFFIGRSFK